MNDMYKLRHKPQHSEKVKYHQGYFQPQHPEKWLTKQIIYRSGWEYLFCRWADENPNIKKVASEPIAVKYLNPVANLAYCTKNGLNPNDPRNWKVCNYYTDFWIEIEDSQTGEVKRIFIEIKPFSQTQCPKQPNPTASLKEHKAYNNAAQTYLVNQAKWKAAKELFESRGAEFMVVTEKTLQKLGLLK